MKRLKIFLVILVSFICSINVFSADYITSIYNRRAKITGTNQDLYTTIELLPVVSYKKLSYSYRVWDKFNRDSVTITEYSYIPTDSLKQTVYIPTCIYNRWKLGQNLTIAGSVTFSIGAIFMVAGGLMYGINAKIAIPANPNNISAGVALMGVGGTLVSCSIPMFCFGDNIKREASTTLRTFELINSIK